MTVGQSAAGPKRSRRWFLAPQPEDDLSSHALRLAIGGVGLLLPWGLVPLAAARSVGGFPGWWPLDSISQYYHSGAVSLLTGALASLAIFLFTYRGFANDKNCADQGLGVLAGIAALGVSFFPTRPDPRFVPPSWWAPWMSGVHYTCAIALFVSFILYSLWLFPTSDVPQDQRDPGKVFRNRIYLFCGGGMIVCVGWAGLAGLAGREIFWPESLALSLFGWSWLTKGRAGWTLKAVGDRLRSR